MYQVSISLNGSFLFRTEWMSKSPNTTLAIEHIIGMFSANNDYEITLQYKTPTIWSVDIIQAYNLDEIMTQLEFDK